MTNELRDILISLEEKKEKPVIALKGVFREYLICSNKNVYIIKKGYMTGHFFGENNFHIPYSKITNIEIDTHLATGSFEISAAGLENKKLNYWSKNLNEDPAKQPNCLSIIATEVKNFEKAKDYILENNATKVVVAKSKVEKSIPEQIREYKELLDDGIITKKEFEEKKKDLLSK